MAAHGETGGEHQARERGLTARERSAIGRLSELLGFADLVAVLMVLATGFTAFATWRTATIANALYLASERPYFGVESVELDTGPATDTRVIVHYQNFGNVSAEDVVLSERLFIDGKPVAKAERKLDAGIISPHVPHELYVHVPDAEVEPVRSGHAQLVVQVRASYRGGDPRVYCYLEKFVYFPETDLFDVNGGTPRCDEQRD